MTKTRSDAKLKNLDPEIQKQLHEYMRDHSVKEAVVFCRDSLNVSTSTGALSGWLEWYEMRQTLMDARDLTNQIKSELKAMPDLNVEDETINRFCQKYFEVQAMKTKDSKLFTAMRRLRISERNLDLAFEEYKQGLKSDMEKGLEALFLEIRGNSEAEELFSKLKAVVDKSMEGNGK
ncbi:MAG: hypothetical protein V2A34_02530 [Lentisphaerota bacterium]